MADNLVAAFERLWAKKNVSEVAEGLVLTAQEGLASVVLAGSAQPTQAVYSRRRIVQAGDSCVLIRTKRTARWIIVETFGKPLSGTQFTTPGVVQPQLSPPSGIRVKGKYVEWNAPPQYPVAFEVQTSDDESELDATTHLVTRGSYFFMDTLGVTFVRVRSIGLDFKKSTWSDWIEYSPPDAASVSSMTVAFALSSPVEIGTIAAGETVERVVLDVTTAYNGTLPTLKVGDAVDDDRLMTTDQNLPGNVAAYEVAPLYEYGADTTIYVYVAGSGMSTGAGAAYIFVRSS